ncbi:MAG: hypothetical protein U0234_17740 [Sandaracinus sp.]
MRWKVGSFVMATSVCGWIASGCGGLSYAYDSGSIHPIEGSAQLRAATTGAIDARDGGGGRGADDELRDVQRSVEEHLVHAGLASDRTAVVPAPTSPGDVDRILAAAAARGDTSVLFVRYHGAAPAAGCGSTAALGIYLGLLPWLILDSIPFWHHGAYSMFEVVAVDAQSHDILARTMRVATFSEHVSAWGCGADGVMHDMERRALEAALEHVVEQGRGGWPHRQHADDYASIVVAGPTFRRAGNVIAGPGFLFEAPPEMRMAPREPGQPMRALQLTADDGFSLNVVLAPSDVNDHDFANDYTNVFRGREGFAAEQTVTIGDLEGRQFEVPLEQNMTVQRVTAAGGMAVVLMCSGDARVLAAHRGECQHAMESLRMTGELVSDGHR